MAGQNRDTTKAREATRDRSRLAKRLEAATLLLEASYPKRVGLRRLNEILVGDNLGSIEAGTVANIWSRIEKARARAERAKIKANGHTVADAKSAGPLTPVAIGYVQHDNGSLLPVYRLTGPA